MNLSSTPKPKLLLLPIAALAISLTAGLLAGRILKSHDKDSSAASTNITVESNNQIISQDQSTTTQTITRTSTVTVKNSEASHGYTLTAKLDQNTLPNSTVSIGSSSSTTCTVAKPCELGDTAVDILSTDNDNATTQDGDTTAWTVRIQVPANSLLDNYIVDIAYDESANPNPISNMQDFSRSQCDALAIGTIQEMRDTRDSTVYRVKKMPDGNCWMVDDLSYDIADTSGTTGQPTFNPTATKISGTTTSVASRAQYVQSPPAYNIPNNGEPKASYLYNWCAALGDTSANCTASRNATNLQTVINGTRVTGTATDQPEVTGICPVPFRLPKGGPNATSIDLTTTANEFAGLDIYMGGTGTGRDNANTYSKFLGSTTNIDDWFGVLGGSYHSGFKEQGASSWWWSSTASNTYTYRFALYASGSHVSPSSRGGTERQGAHYVRCLL